MNSFRKKCSVSLLIALLAGIVFLSGNTAAHAHAATQPHQNKINNWAQIVSEANPYVHIVNNVATIDAQLQTKISPDELALVQQAVAHYNAIPLTTRQYEHMSGSYTPTYSSNGKIQPQTVVGNYGNYQWRIDVYWWGVRIWINSPAAQNFAIFWGIVGGVIGNAIGGAIGTLIGALAGYEAAIVDNACLNRGVFIDVSWIGNPHFTPVC